MPAETLDPTFDFRTDTPPGKDPDSHSPTLRRYHRQLWSKPLPDGRDFTLEPHGSMDYLLHESAAVGRFTLSSDAAFADWNGIARMAKVQPHVEQATIDAFVQTSYTMGGMMLWPANKIDNKLTINGARGLKGRIADRMDLTMEAVRRHYEGGDSPLADVFERYGAFFDLFGDFDGFVEFWLLEDMLDCDGGVAFHAHFDDYETMGYPTSPSEYLDYLAQAGAAIEARGRRMAEWVEGRPSTA